LELAIWNMIMVKEKCSFVRTCQLTFDNGKRKMQDVRLLELTNWQNVRLLELAKWQDVHLLELAEWDVPLLELVECERFVCYNLLDVRYLFVRTC